MEIRDGDWVMIDHEFSTGRSTWMKEEDGKYLFRVDMPINDILDANNDALVDTIGRKFGEWRRIASVPDHLVHKNGLEEAMAQKDKKWLNRWFNDSDNAKFRTSRGRV